MDDVKQFADLKGKTLTKIEGAEAGSDVVTFTVDGGQRFQLYHSQDCCESVSIVDIVGDVADLIGHPLLECEEVTNADDPKDIDTTGSDSYTWTFYKMATIKGSLVIRWLG